jgi:hypothetical protein
MQSKEPINPLGVSTRSNSNDGGDIITMTEKSLEVVDVIPFPVPLSFAGNSSGVMAYRTPYMI